MKKLGNSLQASGFFTLGVTAGMLAGQLDFRLKILVASVSMIISAACTALLRARLPALALLASCGALLFWAEEEVAQQAPQPSRCREKVCLLIDSVPYPSPDTAPLVKAMVTADRSDLPWKIRDDFRKAGAAHLLALSGMHLGIIYGIIKWLTAGLGNSPVPSCIRSGITIAITGAYTLAVGAGASIVRAFLFICLGETGHLLQRHQSAANVLTSALMIQLAASPSVITDLGFQLSYLAVAGIVTVKAPLCAMWKHSGGGPGIMKRIWDSAAISLSAQCFTWPLVLIRFGTFPRHFLLTNLLAIPLTTLTISGNIAVLAFTALGKCPDSLVRCGDFFCTTLIKTLHIISEL